MRRWRWNNRAVALWFVALTTFWGGEALGEYVPNHVVVFFRAGVLSPPSGQTGGSPGEFSYSSESPEILMEDLGVTHLDRAVPSFEPGAVQVLSVTGDSVTLPFDLSNLYLVELADTSVMGTVDAFRADTLNVRFAHPDWIGEATFNPNDSLFTQQWGLQNTGQFGGTVGPDIRANQAWNIATGLSNPVKVAIMDTGVDQTHPDLVPLEPGYNIVSGGAPPDDVAPNSHGTSCAGIVGAKGNNRIGVSGINWGAKIVPIKLNNTGSYTSAAVANALDWARVNGIPIVSMSLAFDAVEADNALSVASINAHTAGTLLVAAMGNNNSNVRMYPAGYTVPVLAVGAVFLDGLRWNRSTTAYPGCLATQGPGGSNWGSWIDLAAPGGDMIATTIRQAAGSYAYVDGDCDDGFGGTSAATPMVAGVASLVKAKAPGLTNEDIAQVLKRSASDVTVYGVGFDNETGDGVVNAEAALRFISGGRVVEHGVTGAPYVHSTTGLYEMTVFDAPCVPGGRYWAKRSEVRVNVAFSTNFSGIPDVWVRGNNTVGWSNSNPHSQTAEGNGWGGIVPGTLSAAGCVLYSHVYELFYYFSPGQRAGWCPRVWQDALFSWTAIGPVGATTPDTTLSYYVPQSGSVASPNEGAVATSLFRACPNNDGGTSLPNSARLKVVVRNASGTGVSGIPAADIYLLLTGGSPQQGFAGSGADSVVANSRYNKIPLCPDVRVIHADGPTDATGTTYITFTGTSGTPGVGSRDPSRKWGHYDTEIPVYVHWRRLQGRFTSGSANGTYSLQVKNYDFTFAGLGTALNQGEAVASDEFSYVANNIGQKPSPSHPLAWWADFNSNGEIDSADFNGLSNHVTHDCNTPNDP